MFQPLRYPPAAAPASIQPEQPVAARLEPWEHIQALQAPEEHDL